MSAKGYLEQIETTDIRINNKLKERDSLYRMSISTITSLGADKVQTSKNPDKMGKLTDKRIDLEKEIDEEIDYFVNIKHGIINQINKLSNPKHIEILHKKYVEYKTYKRLEDIADEFDWSYDYTKEVHGKALKEFEKILLNPTQNPPKTPCKPTMIYGNM